MPADKFPILAQLIDDSVCVLDAELRILYRNEPFSVLVGRQTNLSSADLLDLVHKADRSRVVTELGRAFKSGFPIAIDFSASAGEGLTMPMRLTAQAQSGADGTQSLLVVLRPAPDPEDSGQPDDDDRYRLLVEFSPEAIFAHRRGRFTLANAACAQLLRVSGPEALIGRPVLEFLHPDSRREAIRRAIALGSGRSAVPFFEEKWIRGDGSSFIAEVAATKVQMRGASLIHVILRDISARKLAETKVAFQNDVLGALVAGEPLNDTLRRIVDFIERSAPRVQAAIERVVEVRDDPAELLVTSSPWSDVPESTQPGAPAVARAGARSAAARLLHPRLLNPLRRWIGVGRARVRELEPAGSDVQIERLPIYGRDDVLRGTVLWRARPRPGMEFQELDAEHQPDAQMLRICADLAGAAIEARYADERIRYMATHDAVTGLANRFQLGEELTQRIAATQGPDAALAVVFLKLDRFKAVNDALGYERGDRLVREMAGRIARQLRAGDFVARFGRDDFVVLVDLASDIDALTDCVQRLIALTAQPVLLDGAEVFAGAVGGVAVYPRHGRTPEALIRNAEAALLSVRGAPRTAFAFYEEPMNAHAIQRLETEVLLRRAVSDGQLTVMYQPKVTLYDNRIAGAEALVRWNRPEQGVVAPAHFIPIAEETGLIHAIGSFVLETVCADAREFQQCGIEDFRVSVNLSALQLGDPELPAQFLKTIEDAGVAASMFDLEITETMLLHNFEQSTAVIEQLRTLGATVSIDDFGTGYSSFSYLKRLPVDCIKIDRSFVSDLPNDIGDLAIVRSVCSVARALNLEVVAEGVETEAQLVAVRDCGCDLYQGFLHSRPLPVAQLLAMIDAERRPAVLDVSRNI